MKKNNSKGYFEIPIISGKFKGKKILIPNISTTRSTKSIIRESLFNTLQFDIVDKNFVEMFAGSGSVGIEALSRGAKNVYFIEQGKQAHDILKQNLKNIDSQNATAIQADSFEYFPKLHSNLQSQGVKTYFYFDPPFNTREGMDEIYENTISLIESIDPSICELTIIEHISSLSLPQSIATQNFIKKKKFGKTTLSYFKP